MSTVLLQTKLHRPSLSPKRIQRPRLIQRLNEGLESGRRITLVSAPAGFGKTTCICEWADGLDLPVAWLSLDPSDDDPGRFVIYLVAALQKVDGNLGQEIESILRSGQLPPGEIISTTLINDILDLETRFLLVLDDFQVIQDGFIFQVMEKLVDNIPEQLHLVLLTREDPSLPLARLRANNQMTEIRAGDLRFTGREADRFLNEVMGLCLSSADIAVLEDRTEGWVVGLQLAGLSIRDRENPSGFIATLSGSHRYILNYLTEEVLSRQPEEIQQFLLETSILDKLSGDLCNAVTGRIDAHSLLERLFNANLFLVSLDDEKRWYRYHHLFADLLRDQQSRIKKEPAGRLHQRASQWYERAGMASEAIAHSLAAADYSHAMQLIEDNAMPMTLQGYVKTVEGWLHSIPPEWIPRSPKTNMAFAWTYFLRGMYAQVPPYLELVRAALSDFHPGEEENTLLKADWLALQSMLLSVQGKAAEGLDLANQALEIVPAEDCFLRSLIYVGLASAYRLLDDYTRAVEAYQMAILYSRTAGNFVSEMLSVSHLALMAIQRGQLRFAFEIASQGIERAERSRALPPITAAVYGALGRVCYQWNQTEEAHRHFLREIHLSSLSGHNASAISSRASLSRLLQTGGNLEAAAREIQKAVDLMELGVPAWIRPEVISQQVRIYLAQHRLAEAETALGQQGFSLRDALSIPDLAPGQGITHPVGLLYNSALRTLLYRAQAEQAPASLRPGIEVAGRVITAAFEGRYVLVALEALLLRARMHAALGNDQASLADTAKALELAEPEGFIGIFVEEGAEVRALVSNCRSAILNKGFEMNEAIRSRLLSHADRILQSFPSPTPTANDSQAVNPQRPEIGGLIEPLTEREREVLRLMAEGLKYEEIAGRLFISLNTVRSHVRVAYGKLNVNNRTKALEMARMLRIL